MNGSPVSFWKIVGRQPHGFALEVGLLRFVEVPVVEIMRAPPVVIILCAIEVAKP